MFNSFENFLFMSLKCLHLWEGKLGRTAKGDPFSVISARSQKYRWQILLAIKNPGFGLTAIALWFYVIEYKGGNLSKFRITWKAWLIESPPVKVADMNIWATQRNSLVFMRFTSFHMFSYGFMCFNMLPLAHFFMCFPLW